MRSTPCRKRAWAPTTARLAVACRAAGWAATMMAVTTCLAAAWVTAMAAGRARAASSRRGRRSCATMDVHRRLLSRDPAYARARAEIENHARLYEHGIRTAARPGVTRIPVVVHVVWNTAAQNISDAQITSQIDVLNRDYRRTNPDVSSTPAPFLPLTADARVEFFLATVDPNGAPTTGIERRQTTVTSFSRQRCREAAGDRRHGRMAGRSLSQHLGLPVGRRPARLRPIPGRPAGDRRCRHPAVGIRHHGHGGTAVPSRPHRHPRDRPLAEPESHLG